MQHMTLTLRSATRGAAQINLCNSFFTPPSRMHVHFCFMLKMVRDGQIGVDQAWSAVDASALLSES